MVTSKIQRVKSVLVVCNRTTCDNIRNFSDSSRYSCIRSRWTLTVYLIVISGYFCVGSHFPSTGILHRYRILDTLKSQGSFNQKSDTYVSWTIWDCHSVKSIINFYVVKSSTWFLAYSGYGRQTYLIRSYGNYGICDDWHHSISRDKDMNFTICAYWV